MSKPWTITGRTTGNYTGKNNNEESSDSYQEEQKESGAKPWTITGRTTRSYANIAPVSAPTSTPKNTTPIIKPAQAKAQVIQPKAYVRDAANTTAQIGARGNRAPVPMNTATPTKGNLYENRRNDYLAAKHKDNGNTVQAYTDTGTKGNKDTGEKAHQSETMQDSIDLSTQYHLAKLSGIEASRLSEEVKTKKAANDQAAAAYRKSVNAINDVLAQYGATVNSDGEIIFQTQEGIDAYNAAVAEYQSATQALQAAYTDYSTSADKLGRVAGEYDEHTRRYKKAFTKTDEYHIKQAYDAGTITVASVTSDAEAAQETVDADEQKVESLQAQATELSQKIDRLEQSTRQAVPPLSDDEKNRRSALIAQWRGQLQHINAKIADAQDKLKSDREDAAKAEYRQQIVSALDFEKGVKDFKSEYEAGATPDKIQSDLERRRHDLENRTAVFDSWAQDLDLRVRTGEITKEQFDAEVAAYRAGMERKNEEDRAAIAQLENNLTYAWSLYTDDIKNAKDFDAFSQQSDDSKKAWDSYFYITAAEGFIPFGWIPAAEKILSVRVSNLIGEHDDEQKIFNYIYNTQGEDVAFAYLDSVQDTMAQKSGIRFSELTDKPVIRELATGMTGYSNGFRNLVQLFKEDPIQNTGLVYAAQMLRDNANSEGKKLPLWLMEAAESAGNMAPGIAAGAINPVAGQVVFGLSAAGGAYREYKEAGLSTENAAIGGVLRGLSEVFTQTLLGGLDIPGFSGIFTGKLAETLGANVGSAFGKAAIKYGVEIASEAIEENAQNYIEAAINLGIGAADKYEMPTVDDFIDTTMSTVLLTGITNSMQLVGDAKSAKYNMEFTKDIVNPWVEKALSGDLPGYSNLKAYAKELQSQIADGAVIDAEEFQTKLLEAAVADAKKYQGGKARLATEQEQADFRTEQVKAENPKATVETSAAEQHYLDSGANLQTARQAAEVLDGIAAGKITAENIANAQIDKLHLTEPFGVKATSESLGIDLQKFGTKSEARANFRATLTQYEQNKVATAQINATQIAQTTDNAVAAESNLSAESEKTTLPATPQTAQLPSVQEVQQAEAPQVSTPRSVIPNAQQIRSVSVSEQTAPTATPIRAAQPTEAALSAPTISAAPEGAMSFSEFRKQFENDKAFRRKYSVSGKAAVSKATQLTAAYEKYKADVARTSGSSNTMTRSEFARDYIANNGKASDTDIDLAYQDYLENNDMERLSDTASENVATFDNDVSGLVQNEYSEMIPAEDAESIDALCKLLDRRMVVDDLGDSNGEWSADGDIKIDAAPEHSGAKSVFVFVAAHEIGHDVKSKISKDAWTTLEDSAISAKGETAVSDKQASNEAYSDESVAREDVACDFIGELLSDKDTLDTFLRSIEAGEQTENLTGIRAVVAATKSFINKITGKQKVNADTEALVQKVQDAFGTDIETARKAVDAMQKAVTAAMQANKNATEDGGVMYAKKDAYQKQSQSRDSFERDKFFDRQIDQWKEKPDGVRIKVGTLNEGSALNRVGFPAEGMWFDVGKIKKSFGKHSDHLTKSVLKEIPNLINNPIAITEYRGPEGNINNTVNVFGMFMPDEKTPIVVGVMMTKAANGSTIINKIRTIHAHGNAEINDSNILYLNENKKRTRRWFQVCGNSVPLNGTTFGLIRSISYSDNRSQAKNIRYSKKDSAVSETPTVENESKNDTKYTPRLMSAKEANAIIERNSARNTPKSPSVIPTAKQAEANRSALEAKAEQYGAIEQGENPSREITVPNRVDPLLKIRKGARTFAEASATNDMMATVLDKDMLSGAFNYTPQRNSDTIESARQWVDSRVDVEEATMDWYKDYKGNMLSADMVARGFVIYNNLATAANNATNEVERTRLARKAASIAQDISVMGTVGGQITQAFRILKQLNPEMRYYTLQRAVNKLQDRINQQYGKDGAPKIKIDEQLAANWMQALREDSELAAQYEQLLFEQIATQVPKSVEDYINAWRYLSMLGNPKTLIRNGVGNANMIPVVMLKQQFGAAGEAIAQRLGKIDKSERTKYLGFVSATKEGRALLKYAADDILSSDVEAMLDSKKYDDSNIANKLDKAIKEEHRKFKAPGLKQWQEATSYMMEKMPGFGDEFYKGFHYRNAFASAALARGYTVEDFTNGNVSENELFEIRAYATKQALESTFNDANAVSNMIRKLKFKGDSKGAKIGNIIIEGVVPFKGTPANLLVRSVEYSPVGLVISLIRDIAPLKSGKITPTQHIDNLAKGASGTVVWGLGWLAAALGFVRIRVDDDDKREGRQKYSLEMFGMSVSLDWLAPASIPFFMGAEVNLMFNHEDGKDYDFLDLIVKSLSDIFAPLLEMSMLSGAKELLDTFAYAYNSDGADFEQILKALFMTPFFSYAGQFVPTLLGQIANTLEPNRTSTYTTSKDGRTWKYIKRNIAKLTEKIPFIDLWQTEYVDAWGRKDSNGNLLERVFNNFLNPAYTNRIIVTDADEEIRMLKETTGKNVSPTKRNTAITVPQYDESGNRTGEKKFDLSAEQYEAYQTEYGQQYAMMATALMNSDYYKGLEPEGKAEAFGDIESLADELGKRAALGDEYVISTKDSDREMLDLVDSGIAPAEAYGLKVLADQLGEDEEIDSDMKNATLIQKINGYDYWTDKQKAAAYTYSLEFNAPEIAGTKPTAEQNTEFKDTYTELANSIFSEVIGSEAFAAADDNAKAEMLADAKELVYFYAKRDYAEKYNLSDDNYNPKEASNKYDTLLNAGLTFDQIYGIKQEFKAIEEDKAYATKKYEDGGVDFDKTAQATDFKKWVDSNRDFTKAQKDVIKDTFKFRRNQPVETERYDKLVDVYKMNPDKATQISKRLIGASNDTEKYRIVDSMRGLSDSEKWTVIKALNDTDDMAIAKINTIISAGVSVGEYIAYLDNRPEKSDGTKNKWSKSKLKQWLSSEISAGRLTRSAANALWHITDKNWTNDPF